MLKRAARIVGLGLLLHLCALWAFDLPHYRVMGVLQRIGLCFAAAGLLALYSPRARTQWAIFAALLLGYAVLLASGGSYAPFENIASRLDHALLGVHVYQLDPGPPAAGTIRKDCVSTLGALATTLLGLRAGDWLRRGPPALRCGPRAPWRCWSASCGRSALPLNKNLWTPSYVLWTGGAACWLLAIVSTG